MDSHKTGRVALMAIHPQFAFAILEGKKKVEFRKRALAEDIVRVLIYATRPVMALIGEFDIDRQVASSPRNLWDRYRHVAGIGRQEFFAYYGSRGEAVGIVIATVKRYPKPIALRAVDPTARAPQSFKYLAASAVPK